MKKIYFLLGLLLSLGSAFAQETHLRNSKWFAYGKMLEFNYPGSPIYPAYWNSQPEVSADSHTSAAASVCDYDGTPLIIVDGSRVVWAKGQNLGSIQNSYNVIIVPKPNHPDRYYIIQVASS